MNKQIRSFSILEITIVIVLMGVLVAFALPQYAKSFAKADERKAIANMKAVRSAMKFYLANTVTTTIPDWANTAAVNAALGLNVIDTTMAYQCWGTNGGFTNMCMAAHPDGWEVGFHLAGAHNTDGSIHCRNSTGTCPSCPDGGAGDCD